MNEIAMNERFDMIGPMLKNVYYKKYTVVTNMKHKKI